MSVLDNKIRQGAISSSKASLLMDKAQSKAKPYSRACETYLKERIREKKFKGSLSVDVNSRPMAWGHFMELYVNEYKLGLDYQHIGDKSFAHPTIDGWVGTPDFLADNKVAELKSYQPNKFTEYAEAIQSKDLELLKKDFKSEYWQIVSNACVLNLDYGEAIAFMPKEEELMQLAKMVEEYDGKNLWHYKYIYDEIIANPENPNIPYIPKGSEYEDLNVFTFEIPKEDKEALTSRVLECLDIINLKKM